MRRRQFILGAGLGGVSALSGCATVAERFERRAADGSTTAAPAERPRETTTRAADGGADAAETASNATGTSVPYDATVPSTPLTDAPVPVLSGAEYAVMGDADAPVVTLYGNWKCPYTREFVVQNLGEIVSKYVEPGGLALRFRALAYLDREPFLGPDAPRAAWAGQAVWRHDPASFWRYFATVFWNQPPERKKWATLAQLRAFARTADVDEREGVAEDVHAGRRDERVRATTSTAGERGVSNVPRLVADGTVVAPNLQPGRTKRLLERTAER